MVEQSKLAVQWREGDSAKSELTKIREQIAGHDDKLDQPGIFAYLQSRGSAQLRYTVDLA
jgi:hypothetical protein